MGQQVKPPCPRSVTQAGNKLRIDNDSQNQNQVENENENHYQLKYF